MRDVVEMTGTWAQPVAFVAVCAPFVLLYLRFRRARASAVRLRDAAKPKARPARIWGPFWQGRSTGLPERFERMGDAEFRGRGE